jgi:DNA-binding NarL/FixJ family response regulator
MIHVALVENDNDVRESLAQYINESPGFKCVCACDTAEDALRVIPKCRPDVVLMDIHLPGRSGIECTRRLKKLCPLIHIIILTVCDDQDKIFSALKAGASGYLLKRTDPFEILDAVKDVKQGGAPMTGQIARKVIQSFREKPSQSRIAAALSERERELLVLMARGLCAKEIAQQLSVSINTVRTHLQHIYEKLHVHSRSEAIIKYLK